MLSRLLVRFSFIPDQRARSQEERGRTLEGAEGGQDDGRNRGDVRGVLAPFLLHVRPHTLLHLLWTSPPSGEILSHF